ncbi:MAG: helicase associated domain-containing protein, partial [Arthrobacter sp.]
LARMEEVIAWIMVEGRLPRDRSEDIGERSMARWLADRRREAADGSLSPAYRNGLARLPGWAGNARAAADEARWHDRLAQLSDFHAEGNDWPRHRHYASEREHSLGVWVHTQRYQHRGGELDAEKVRLLEEHQIRGENVHNVHTKKHQKAPEQGKHVPEVGLEPDSRPCKHGPPPQTSAIRPSPAPVRPSPRPKVWTLSTPPLFPTKGLPTPAPSIDRVRLLFALENLILPEKFNHGFNQVLPALITASRAHPDGELSLEDLHNDSTSLHPIYRPIGRQPHDPVAPQSPHWRTR